MAKDLEAINKILMDAVDRDFQARAAAADAVIRGAARGATAAGQRRHEAELASFEAMQCLLGDGESTGGFFGDLFAGLFGR